MRSRRRWSAPTARVSITVKRRACASDGGSGSFSKAAGGIAQHQRRDVKQQFIDALLLDQGAGERRAGLHQHLVDTRLAQLREDPREIHPAGSRAPLDARAARDECRGALRIRGRGEDPHALLACAVKHPRPRRCLKVAVENDPQRLAHLRAARPHREHRVIGQDGADTGENRRTACAPALYIRARRLARDPLAATVAQGGAAIQAHGEFQAHQRHAQPHALDEAGVEVRGLAFQQTRLHLHAGLAQPLRAAALDLPVRVADRIDHAGDAGLDQRLAARAASGPDDCRARASHKRWRRPRPMAVGRARPPRRAGRRPVRASPRPIPGRRAPARSPRADWDARWQGPAPRVPAPAP